MVNISNIQNFDVVLSHISKLIKKYIFKHFLFKSALVHELCLMTSAADHILICNCRLIENRFLISSNCNCSCH